MVMAGLTSGWLLSALLAALGLYLSGAHQRLWPAARAHASALRVAAAACALASLAASIALLGVVAGVFASLTAAMLVLVLLPYCDAWRQLRKRAAP